MPEHDIIVIGASAGGVEVLSKLVGNLPADLPAAIFIVLHISPYSTSVLPNILNRCIQKQHKDTSLRAIHPQDGEAIVPGRIYVAPPDHHLIVKRGSIRLSRGPRENSHRPAVDVLFRTAAKVYGPRVVGVVLSGTLDDGTAGLVAVKQRGGVAIVQSPEEALYSGMPGSAIENVDVDYILRVSEMASVLEELAHKPVEQEGAGAVSSEMEMESDIAELELGAMQSLERPGKPSSFGCPDCGGALWELQEGSLIRFRCRTGHAFSAKTLLAEQSEAMEEALWNALRALEEKAALSQRLADRARERNQTITLKRFEEQAQESQQRAAVVRQLLLNGNGNGQVVGELGSWGAGELGSWGAGENGSSFPPSPPHPLTPSPPHPLTPSSFHVVAICASSGGLLALRQVLSGLSADLAAAIIVVQRLNPEQPSNVADILKASTALRLKQAESGDVLRPGTVYIAPENQHLLVNADSTLSLWHSELVHFVRPSADLLFESVAASFKERAIAVVLTGTGSDGAMGVRAIKKMGGTAIAAQADNYEDFGMPSAAINTESVDLVVPLNDIAATLVNLVTSKDKHEQFGS